MFLTQARLVIVRASRATAAALKVFGRGYEPSKHYMRGPGPKAREAELRGERTSRNGTEVSAHG